jgi:hypothetical protein
MTQQYQQTSINAPRGSTAFDANAQLTYDDDLVVADSSANPVLLTLPEAVTIPGWTVFIKAPDGATNPVTIQGTAGQLIDGVPTLVLSTNNSGVILRANGVGWDSFAAGTGGGGVPLAIEDEGAVVDANTNLINFIGPGVTATPAGPPGEVDVTIPGAGALPSGVVIPEGVVPGTSGSLYRRIAGSVSSFWQYLSAVPGVIGWRAIGPEITGSMVGLINGVNTVFTFPGGAEAVHQPATPSGSQIELMYNGVDQVEGIDFSVTAGAVPGTTIVSITTLSFTPIPADTLEVVFIPA